MNETAIRCEGLGKRYRIGQRESYRALRDTLSDALRSPLRLLNRTFGGSRSGNGNDERAIWALRDVSFEIKRGEVVGIIGRNGAGKSTLLKILSRITTPTAGMAEIHGRVGSLLEVGTGFHPELTGRENIYLNGSILGMRKAEIEHKFDEIVAFAEVDEFIDTPVKRYSSGMYVRLAFAVAVHMEPEILVVDEVLAVGDAQFQKRCFNKMQEVSRGGRTILLVSHNLYAVRTICSRTIVLDGGKIVEEGETNHAVDAYLTRISQERETEAELETESFIINKVEIKSATGGVLKTFDVVKIHVRFTAKTDILEPGLYLGLLTLDNQRLAGLDLNDLCSVPLIRAGEQSELGFSIAEFPLLAGNYQIEIALKDMASSKVEFAPQNFPFEVAATPIYGGRQIDSWYGHLGLDVKPIAANFKVLSAD